jgi:hypothetical protein
MKNLPIFLILSGFFGIATASPEYTATLSSNNPIEPIISSAPDCNSVPNNPFANCGFETGDFTGWITQDLSPPFVPLAVQPGGVTPVVGFFATTPTEGSYVAAHGFDGNGPGYITIAQDVTLGPDADILIFDYRAAWDLINFAPPGSLDRHLTVEIQPSGGGAALRTSSPVLTLEVGTSSSDTGNQTASVYIGDFAGQSVRLVISAEVPEAFTGPAFIQFDNFSVSAIQQIPASSFWSLWLLMFGIVVLGTSLKRRLFFR